MESNKILPENTMPAQSKIWKSAFLGVLSLIFQVITWYSMNSAFTQASLGKWIMTGTAAVFAISITTFFLLTRKNFWLSEVLIVLSAVGYFLVSPRNIYVWIGGLIFTLFALWYERRIKNEALSRVDFSVTRVVGGSVSVLVYAILFLLGFNIYYYISADLKANPDKYYNRIAQQASKSVPYVTKALLPANVELNQPLGKYLEQQAANNPEYNSAGSFQKSVIISQVREAFFSQFEISASDEETLADIMAEVIVNRIRNVVEPIRDYLPIIFAVLVVGVLSTFAFLIRWLIIIISWIVFQVLRTVGFFRLEKVQVEVEKLEI